MPFFLTVMFATKLHLINVTSFFFSEALKILFDDTAGTWLSLQRALALTNHPSLSSVKDADVQVWARLYGEHGQPMEYISGTGSNVDEAAKACAWNFSKHLDRRKGKLWMKENGMFDQFAAEIAVNTRAGQGVALSSRTVSHCSPCKILGWMCGLTALFCAFIICVICFMLMKAFLYGEFTIHYYCE